MAFHTAYPAVDDLRNKAQRRIPRFAFEYLDGGCNEDVNLVKNTIEIRKIELKPWYLNEYQGADLRTELFGHVYDAPFGVAPVGLQGLIWPNAPLILAKAAMAHNLPFILSTVSTASIESVAAATEGKAWFQLYNPKSDELRNDILQRIRDHQYEVLVLLCDVPSFGFRPRDIRNGLAMPPKMTLRNVLQIIGKPHWALRTLYYGQPQFATMKKYMPKGLDLKQLGLYMNQTFSGRLDENKIARIRDQWPGKLVLKGVASLEDTEKAVRLGLDGVIVSNHGGRQLDAGQSAIKPLVEIAQAYGQRIKVMMDSGIRTGPDIARTLAGGAAFTFLGRTMMYAVAALGDTGGDHAMSLLKAQLKQVMEQVCCEHPLDLPRHLIGPKPF